MHEVCRIIALFNGVAGTVTKFSDVNDPILSDVYGLHWMKGCFLGNKLVLTDSAYLCCSCNVFVELIC